MESLIFIPVQHHETWLKTWWAACKEVSLPSSQSTNDLGLIPDRCGARLDRTPQTRANIPRLLPGAGLPHLCARLRTPPLLGRSWVPSSQASKRQPGSYGPADLLWPVGQATWLRQAIGVFRQSRRAEGRFRVGGIMSSSTTSRLYADCLWTYQLPHLGGYVRAIPAPSLAVSSFSPPAFPTAPPLRHARLLSSLSLHVE